jgi:hypothetical protein
MAGFDASGSVTVRIAPTDAARRHAEFRACAAEPGMHGNAAPTPRTHPDGALAVYFGRTAETHVEHFPWQ